MARTENIKIKADTSHFKRGIKGVSMAIKGVVASTVALAAPVIALTAAAGGLATAYQSINKAASFETLQIRMANVLKSSKEAAKVMGDIDSFSQSTPFQLEGLTEGVIMLQNADKKLGNQVEFWREIGDASASAGKTFEDTASQVSKFVAATKSKTASIADPLMAMSQELRVINFEQKEYLEKLRASGASSKVMVDALRDMFQGQEGSMLRLSNSYNGLVSTLGDVWSAAQRAFGGELMKTLKVVISDITQKIAGWIPHIKEFARSVARVIGGLYSLLSSKSKWEWIWNFAKQGAGDLVNIIAKGLIAAVMTAGKFMENLWSRKIQALLGMFSNKNFLKAFEYTFISIGYRFASIIGQALGKSKSATELSDRMARQSSNIASNRFKLFAKDVASQQSDMPSFKEVTGYYKDSYRDAPNLINSVMNGGVLNADGKTYSNRDLSMDESRSALKDVFNGFIKTFKDRAEQFTANTTIEQKTPLIEKIKGVVDKVKGFGESALKYTRKVGSEYIDGKSSSTSFGSRPISDLASHGGGGVYSNGFATHQQQMLTQSQKQTQTLLRMEEQLKRNNNNTSTLQPRFN